MAQEISIKLKADTRDAVKAVKDLEKQVAGLDSIKSKGDADKGFLTQEDVKRFQRISADAEKVYRDFYERYNRIQRDFEKKKKDLENAMKRGAGSSTTEQLQREVKELEARRNILSSQASNINDLHNRGMGYQGSINQMRQLNNPTVLQNLTRTLLPALSVATVAGWAKQGAQLIKANEGYMSQLGQQVPGLNGDYAKGRKEAEALGVRGNMGYTSLETMQTAGTYSSLAGATSMKNLWGATGQIQATARTMGLDPNTLAGTLGNLGQIGAVNYQQIKAFKDGMVGAIKETGMAGRDKEFVQAVSGLSEQVSKGQLSLSNGEFNQVLGLQTILNKADKTAFGGERGAQVLSQIDSGIKGGGNGIDLMLGWGSKYQGISGRADLERLKAGGISNPQLMKQLFSNIDQLGGGNKDYQALWLMDTFGISMEQADRLLQPDIMNQLKKGGMSKSQINKLLKSGSALSSKKLSDYTNSSAARRNENNALWQNSKMFAGTPIDWMFNMGQSMFLKQPQFLQWSELGAGALGSGMIGSRLLGGLGRAFSSPLGRTGGGIFGELGSLGSRAGSLFRGGGGLLKGAGRIAGPIGEFMAMQSLSHPIENFGDWLFGHHKGQEIQGMFDLPFTNSGHYKNNRQGAIGKAWDWLFEPDKKKKSSQQKSSELLDKEKDIVDKRKSISDATKNNLDKESKNIGDIVQLSYKTSVNNNSSSNDSTSVFGNFLSGLASIFGLGGIDGLSTNPSSLLAPSSAKNAQYLNENLHTQSGLTAQDINKWIASKAPKNSLMRGQGATFLKAAQASGLDARYLVAHAAEETNWGTSKIAKSKGNFYGIGAFDASPYASAYNYNNTQAGIIEGAKWIAQNFVNKGQNTLYKMANTKGHSYASDPLWDDNIAGIMAGAPAGSGTAKVQVTVNGKIDGLTKENNDLVAQALASKLNSNNVNLAYEFRQGIGGNR